MSLFIFILKHSHPNVSLRKAIFSILTHCSWRNGSSAQVSLNWRCFPLGNTGTCVVLTFRCHLNFLNKSLTLPVSYFQSIIQLEFFPLKKNKGKLTYHLLHSQRFIKPHVSFKFAFNIFVSIKNNNSLCFLHENLEDLRSFFEHHKRKVLILNRIKMESLSKWICLHCYRVW